MIEWAAIDSPTSDGMYAVVRCGPHICATVEVDSITEHAEAKRLARQFTKNHQREQARRAWAPQDPYQRRIPAGFYTDKDAA